LISLTMWIVYKFTSTIYELLNRNPLYKYKVTIYETMPSVYETKVAILNIWYQFFYILYQSSHLCNQISLYESELSIYEFNLKYMKPFSQCMEQTLQYIKVAVYWTRCPFMVINSNNPLQELHDYVYLKIFTTH
jgi:hypothetical protein